MAIIFESAVNLYLDNNELGFSSDTISNALLYEIKSKNKSSIICLEVLLVSTKKPLRILESEPFSETTLDRFISNREVLESYIGLPILIQTTGLAFCNDS